MDWWDGHDELIVENLTDHDLRARIDHLQMTIDSLPSAPQDTLDACRLILRKLRAEARKRGLM